MKRVMISFAAGLFAAVSTSAGIVLETNFANTISTGPGGIYTISGIDLPNNVNVLVVGAYIDNNHTFSSATFGGIPADAPSPITTAGRQGAFYWINPNTSAGQTLELVSSTSNPMAYHVLALSGVDTNTIDEAFIAAASTTLTTSADNMYVVSFYSVNANTDLTPTAPMVQVGPDQSVGAGGGTISAGTRITPAAGSYPISWSAANTANQGLAVFAFAGADVIPYIVHTRFPAAGAFKVTPNDFPVSVGMVIENVGETVDPNAIALYVNGTDVYTGADLTLTGASNVVSHSFATLPTGTNTVQFVFQTEESATPVTNNWSFVVLVPGTPGNLVYVDATTNNTTIWNGAAFDTWVPDVGAAAGNWLQRESFGNFNGYTNDIFQSQGGQARLKTTVSSLPAGVYKVHASFYGAGSGANYRIDAALTDNPGGELPTYSQSQYPANPNLRVPYVEDVRNLPWGNFGNADPSPYYSTNLLANPYGTSAVSVAQLDQRLIHVYLGAVAGTEFSVYVDDSTSAGDFPTRAWYDGVAFEQVTNEPVVLAAVFPLDGTAILETAVPVSIGALMFNATETLDPSSVALYLDGMNVITGGDVVTVGLSNTISHTLSAVAPGNRMIKLVYATTESPGVFYTNTWSFHVSPVWPGTRTYVDVIAGFNTMAWDGTTYAAYAPNGSQDDFSTNWWERFGLGNASSVEVAAYQTNSVRLNTAVTGLASDTYKVYAYFWAAGFGENWRLGASLSDPGPGTPDLPLYLQSQYPANPALYVHYQDANNADAWGTFATLGAVTSDTLPSNPFNSPVLVAEGNRRLVEIYLGAVAGTDISVYLDDDSTGVTTFARTWYDGIGYEVATEPLVLNSLSPTPNSSVGTNTSVTLGAEVLDATETLDEASVKLYLDGGANLITGGDVVKTGAYNNISHAVTGLASGTHSVELVYATDESLGVLYTNAWSFTVESSVTLSPVPALSATLTGNSLVLAWSSMTYNYTGYRLEVQTNTLAVGLSSNWFPIPGTEGQTSYTNTVDPANPTVFYRLVYP